MKSKYVIETRTGNGTTIRYTNERPSNFDRTVNPYNPVSVASVSDIDFMNSKIRNKTKIK